MVYEPILAVFQGFQHCFWSWDLDPYPDPHQREKSDPDQHPDPHQIKNQNPDPHPYPYQGDKPNPDPLGSKKELSLFTPTEKKQYLGQISQISEGKL
jgi:hypothetical protein